jgi:YidC/Oxa1 family membrane protein insertase
MRETALRRRGLSTNVSAFFTLLSRAPVSLQSQPSPEDQRRTLIAIALITLIAFVWMWSRPAPAPPTSQEEPVTDTTDARQRAEDRAEEQQQLTQQQRQAQEGKQARQAQPPDVPAGANVQDSLLTPAQTGEARQFVVETERYWATFSTKGATLTSLKLRDHYKAYDYGSDERIPVQMVDTTSAGALSLAFTTPQNHLVNTRALYFEPRLLGGGGTKALEDASAGDTLRVTGGADDDDESGGGRDSLALAFEAKLGGGTLRQVYTFDAESYEVDLRVEQENPQQFATADGYDLVWDGGLPFTEVDPEDEARQAGAFVRHGGEVVGMNLTENASNEKSYSGEVGWAAAKNKYFTAAMLPQGATRRAELVGEQTTAGDGKWESYTMRLQMPRQRAEVQVDRFRLYLGPVDYYKLSTYDAGLYDMVDYGWGMFEWMTRPIAKYVFIPIFKYLGSIIPSIGIVIILLAIIVKSAVYPLTKSSYKSMAKMRELQPRMEAIREEHEDDQQKQQEEMMKMYKETGVNPIGGCLPMLLQYPVLIALWQFLPTSIDIRQESFLWAHDLSVPDVVLNLPFEIPLYGDYVAGFTVLMGLSMVVSMSMQSTGSGGGQMAFLKYFMPVVIFFIFNRFAAGLSLYYLIYNIVTAAQQKYINIQIENEKDEGEGIGGNGAGSKDDLSEKEQIREERRRHRREAAKT